LSVENIYDSQNDPDISEEEFNDKLRQLRKSIILSCLTSVFDDPQYIESGLLFRKIESTQKNPIANKGNFVGVRLQVSEGGYGVTLKNAILLLNGVRTFNLYLFHSLTNGTDTIGDVVTDVPYIKKWEVTSKANSQTVVPLNYELAYSNDIVKGGVWFLGYFQDDLDTVKALDYNPVPNCYNIVGGIAFESKASNGDFDREIYGKSAGMYGLNVEIASYVDHTEQIVNSAHLFDNLQGLMMAAKVIEMVYNSTRSNANQRLNKENISMLYSELNAVTTADRPFVQGLKRNIVQEIEKIQEAFEDDCDGITVTTVR
jgi:hypothetical protein